MRLIDKRRRHTFDFKKAIDIGKRDRTDKGLSGRKGFGSEGTLYPILEANAEILHDGFIKIFTNFSFRGEASLGTWVTRVMVTQALDYLRRQKRVSQLEVHEEQLPDIPDLPEGGEAGRISEEQLMKFVADLPDGCRTVFNLYVFEEKSHKEIADMLGIKEHSSTSQLHRAKFLLAKRIKEYRNHEERK